MLPDWYYLRRTLVWFVTQKFLVGVVGIVLNDDGKILLLKHSYRKEYPWGLPSGWLKKGERPSDGISREIFEETGLEVQVKKPLFPKSDPKWARLDLIFLCVIKDGEIRLSDEVVSVRFFNVEDLPPILESQKNLILETLSLLKAETPEIYV